MSTSVLVVDDDVGFRQLVGRMIRAHGLTVVAEVGCCASALAACARVRPDAALIDVGLPDGDGVELATHVAAQPWRPRVVLTSSDADAVDGVALQRAGAVGFLAKELLPNGTLRALLVGD
jgi:DNA-binding NarL/FixJ family response regulator